MLRCFRVLIYKDIPCIMHNLGQTMNFSRGDFALKNFSIHDRLKMVRFIIEYIVGGMMFSSHFVCPFLLCSVFIW